MLFFLILADHLVLTNSVGERNTSKVLTNWKNPQDPVATTCASLVISNIETRVVNDHWSSRHTASYMYIVLYLIALSISLHLQHLLVFVFPWISLIICLSWSIKTTSSLFVLFLLRRLGLVWFGWKCEDIFCSDIHTRMTSYQLCARSKEDYLTTDHLETWLKAVRANKTRFKVLTCQSFLILILKHT